MRLAYSVARAACNQETVLSRAARNPTTATLAMERTMSKRLRPAAAKTRQHRFVLATNCDRDGSNYEHGKQTTVMKRVGERNDKWTINLSK